MASTPEPLHSVELLHLIDAATWKSLSESKSERYRAPSLDEVGFFLLSSAEQVHLPANRLYAGREDLLLLVIDQAQLDAPVRWEPGVPTDPSSMTFPHLYGSLPTAAVVDIRPYRPDANGTFPQLT